MPRRLALAIVAMAVLPAAYAGDRLLATGGVMQVEGSAGGGLTPWALIAGLGTDAQVGVSGYCTQVKPDDFRLTSCGAAIGAWNRFEISLAQQKFDLGTTVPGASIEQRIFGVKIRLLGDAVTEQDNWVPQVAVGTQFKHNQDFDLVPTLLGAHSRNGVDFYVAATKVWLAGPFGRSWLGNLTARSTRGNQMGILGFGGDQGGRKLLAEASVGAFLNDNLVLGVEYRQKPDNLSAFREDDFKDVFLAWIPVKYVSLTLAYADLGNIADKSHQRGSYLSLQGSW
jgi:Protein of unknown function (DUF3034)